MKYSVGFVLFFLLCLGVAGQYSDAEVHGENVTESPYFLVRSGDDFKPGDFGLKGTHVEVQVSGVIAQVTVEQTYENLGSEAIDATYVFPGSTHAAVYAMEMRVGEHKVVAQIKEKEEAQRIFDEAQEAGQTASLMTQHRPNVFQMDVANIRAGNMVKVKFSYTENLVPTDNEYSFVFPTIVGPRYTTPEGLEQDPWIANPYTNSNDPRHAFLNPSFTLNFNLDAGLPISSAQCVSYPGSALEYASTDVLNASLTNREYQQAKNEYVFKYKLVGEQIASGMLTYDHGDEKFFMMTVQPPKRHTTSEIPPRDYMFIVDVSGSMSGFPLEVSKELMRNLLSSLSPGDRFNLLLFASGFGVYSEEMIEVNAREIERAIAFMDERHSGGGTEILPAVSRALEMVDDTDRSVSIVLATDGLVSVEREAFDLITQSQNKANFFPFGIGTSMNRYLIEGLAHVSHTEPMICTTREEARKEAQRFKEMVSHPLLTNIQVDWGGSEVYDVLPASVPDLFANKPLVIYGKYKGKMDRNIQVSGTTGTGKYQQKVRSKSYEDPEENEALRYLWARQQLKLFSDYQSVSGEQAYKSQITEIGLKYSLLSKYTSFVAVDERDLLEEDEEPDTVPRDYRKQNHGGGVPEPGEWALIILSTLMIGFLFIWSPWKQ